MVSINDEYKLVAAIVVAIREYEGTDSEFQIKSIKRLYENRWRKAGRDELLKGREQIYLNRRRPT